MDLSFIQEQCESCIDDIYDAMDALYIKRLLLEQDIDSYEGFSCFQEGVAAPKIKKELDMFKFDNKYIIKAIKHFNKAINSVKEPEENKKIRKLYEKGSLDELRSFVRDKSIEEIRDKYFDDLLKEFRNKSGSFEKGFQALKEQFKCSFKIFLTNDPKFDTGTLPTKETVFDYRKLTVSSKKGFQLGGIPIQINVNIRQILEFVPADNSLFGQSFTGIILHEIFHNIFIMMNTNQLSLEGELKEIAKGIKNTDTKDETMAKFNSLMNSIGSKLGIKNSDLKDKKRLANRLFVLSKISDNPAALKKFEDDIKNDRDKTVNEDEIDGYIKTFEKIERSLKIGRIGRIIGVLCTIILTATGIVFGSAIATAAGGVLLGIMTLKMIRNKYRNNLLERIFHNKNQLQEYYCDLFASMYQLPIYLQSYQRELMFNKINKQKVSRIRDIENSISKLQKDPHPTTFDRAVVSYNNAKKLLNSGKKLKPQIRKYLEYIVKSHEGINDIENNQTEYTKKHLDPEAAADLNKMLNDLVNETGTTVTESYIMYVGDY